MRRICIVLVIMMVMQLDALAGFSGIEQGKTTKEGVQAVLGTPGAQFKQDGKDVWQYEFSRTEKSVEVVLKLSLVFDGDIVAEYSVSASQESTSAKTATASSERPEERRNGGGGNSRSGQGGGGRASGLTGDFMADHDLDKDGKVTREEFSGPERAFDRFDANDDGIVEESEAPPPRGQRGGGGGGGR